MTTKDLILTLAADVRRVPRFAVARRLAIGVVMGAVVSLLAIALTIGFRPDLWTAMQGGVFWMKGSYAIALAAVAGTATVRLARPDPRRLRPLWWIAVPVALLATAGIGELIRTPRGEWLSMWLGQSWRVCPWLVFVLAMPVGAGMLWSFRGLAPTRLRAAGATAGLAAGAVAAMVYCLHCPEVSALFVLTWYSLGMLLVAGLGALLGPRVLRW